MSENKVWGIDYLEQEQKEQAEVSKQEYDEINILYQKCFNTAAGKKVLEHLKKCTLSQPCWIPSPGNDGVHHGFIREGQNSVVRSIVERININKK